MSGMEATLRVIRDLIAAGEGVMWIVGPGEMVSENTSRGIQEPRVHGPYITITAHNWRFHLEPELVDGIQLVETYGDLSSHYVRFSDHDGETLVRAYMPKGRGELERPPDSGHAAFDKMRARYEGTDGVEYVRREVLMSSFG